MNFAYNPRTFLNPVKELPMKLMPVLLALAFSAGSVFAADMDVKEKKPASPAQIAQREKMKVCNADAKKNELKGDARKKFMSECLKGGAAE